MNLTSEKFGWQNDFYAVSVSESQLARVRDYIRKQEEHHSKKTLEDEIKELCMKHGFDNGSMDLS